MSKPVAVNSVRNLPLLQIDQEAFAGVRESGRRKRKSPDGIPTTQLVLSAYVGTNAEVFPVVLSLHVPEGSVVADVTYGKGIFWKNVPKGKYAVAQNLLQRAW
jgi:hypothetical protein